MFKTRVQLLRFFALKFAFWTNNKRNCFIFRCTRSDSILSKKTLLEYTKLYKLLYPTQRVAEGIMFLTRPSVSQSVRQSCFSCQRNSSETAQFAYSQEIDSIFSLGITPFLNLEIWPKWKILLKTVCQRNSSETAQQNFVNLCSYEGHNI